MTDLETVQAAVVSIRVKTAGDRSGADATPAYSAMPPAYTQLPDLHFPDRRLGQFDAQGAGFFIDPRGLIVTSKHVIDGAKRIVITTKSGERFDARIVGADSVTDLALLELEMPQHVQRSFVRFAPRPARVGERVYAVGNPFGLSGSVTSGIVSASDRSVGGGAFDNYLQIDAAINRGNSGGPTFDQWGDVIGVNTAIFSPTGNSIGIAFAIPAQTAIEIIDQLRTRGYVERGWLGLEVQAITPQIASGLALSGARGVLVTEIRGDGPAVSAGVHIGDVVESIDGREVETTREFANRVSSATPGQALKLSVRRGAERVTLAVTVGRRELGDQSMKNSPRNQHAQVKLSLAPAKSVTGEEGPGLIVSGMDTVNGDASDVDLMVGDIILRAGGRDVTTSKEIDAERIAARARSQSHFLLLVRREGSQRFVAVSAAAAEQPAPGPDAIILTAR